MFEDRTDLIETAIFAGGCFWCIESAFLNLEGVRAVESGYIGGTVKNPTYQMVCSRDTGHYEAVRIRYNPLTISYINLLNIFFMQIDPEDENGQFADRGSQYKSAIFYTNEFQKKLALGFIEKLNNSGIFNNKIATEIKKAEKFYLAEEYHQDYSIKNELEFNRYKEASGRKQYIVNLWKGAKSINEVINKNKFKKPSDKDLKKKLSKFEYLVTQKKGTERPFDNKYWDNTEDGIYVDIISKEPLFSSFDKYDSKSGWPSFTKPLVAENVVYSKETGLFDNRIEVKSKLSDSHLGHVFEDGIGKTGLRYCMNSAALKFIKKDELKENNLEEYLYFFN